MARHYADLLGAILSRGEPQLSTVRELQSAVVEEGSLEFKQVINHPLQKYDGRTAVHLAASRGLWECLELLLKEGGDPNVISSATDLCQTPLHLAACAGHVKCLQVLLSYQADVEKMNSHRLTARDVAKGNPQCERVLEQGVARTKILQNVKDEDSIIIRLHQLAEDPEKQDEFYHLVDDLPEGYLDLSTRKLDFLQLTLLTRACNAGSIDVVRYLLSKSPSEPLPCLTTGDTPLLSACRHGSIAMAALLLEHSIGLLFKSDSTDHLTPLHVACSRGDLDMVRLQLEYFKDSFAQNDHLGTGGKLSLNFRDRLGRTPLFNACYWGHDEVVGTLLNFARENQSTVDLDVSPALSQSKRTPLHAAACSGSVNVAKMLVLADADVNAEALPSTHTRHVLLQAASRAHVLESSSPKSASLSKRRTSAEKLTPPSGLLVPTRLHFDDSTEGVTTGSPGGFNATALTSSSGSFALNSPSSLPDECFMTPQMATWSRHFAVDSVAELDNCKESASMNVRPTSTRAQEVWHRDSNNSAPPSEVVDFGRMMVTPLVEACACGQTEVARVLLEGRAWDSKGLACRMALLVGCPDLAQLVLSYHIQVFQKKTLDPQAGVACTELELEWSERGLSEVQGSWFNERTPFYVALRQYEMEEEEDPNICSYSNIGLARGVVQVNTSTIRCVHLRKNALKEVPLELFCLQSVLIIDLMDNEITELPEARGARRRGAGPTSGKGPLSKDRLLGWRCDQLQKLLVSRNRLVSLPTCIWSLQSLVTLEASHNKLKSLPQGPEDANMLSRSIEDVDFSHNELEMVPKCLFELPSVKTVLLDQNKLESLPETMWICSTLKELNLSRNSLTSLPWCEPEESLMPSQQEAGTGHIALMKNSTKNSGVNVEVVAPMNPGQAKGDRLGAAISSVQDTPGVTEGCDHSALLKLDLSDNQLAYFPEALPCLAPNLAELDVSRNRFETIDVQFVPHFLQKLTAKDCSLKHFGTVLDANMYWQVLKNCRHGMTFGLPCQHRSHRQLPYLSVLFLQRNKLRCFQLLQHPPAEGREDPGEEEKVFVAQTSFPELLYPVLEGLDLSSNDLQGLFNPNIGHQSHLRWVKLDGNHGLEKIPMEFAYLKSTRQFTELSLCDLPNLTEPPKEYQLAGLNHLLSYMKSRLKESVQYKTLKIFIIGKSECGKTTLLRRLKNLPHDKVTRTAGIDIEDWYYPEVTKSILKRAPKDTGTHFIVWDCAGQEGYQAMHMSFYSRRSVYLALFRLSDGSLGVDELDPWLRNLQFRAPGCPVIIVGTHLDTVAEHKAAELEKLVQSKYQDTRTYPKVVAVVSVSTAKRSSSSIDRLRRLIYEVTCRLQLSSDETSLEYKRTMSEDDPRTLFQEQVPIRFLELQKAIKKDVASRSVTGSPPVMLEEEFKKSFGTICEDEDEFQDAVSYLHFQGTLLHFEDVALRSLYFLDPQWLTKLLANLINPSSAADSLGLLVKDGVVEISELLEKSSITSIPKDQYIQLLEKFEVALKINQRYMIVPSMMPFEANYPLPHDNVEAPPPGTTAPNLFRSCHTLRRLWLSSYVSVSFWPRLICRVAMDQNVNRVLDTLLSNHQPVGEEDGNQSGLVLNWVPWKMGVAYVSGGRTLLVIRQQTNNRKSGQFRIEVHVHTSELMALSDEFQGADPGYILSLATHLLVMLSQHVVSLALDWFPGMLLGHPNPSAYVPCWKCYEAVDCTTTMEGVPPAGDDFIYHNQTTVHCFDVDQCVAPAVSGRELMCVFHNRLEPVDMVPDLIFWDLQYTQKVSNSILKIREDEVLGKGGYGIVCKGELTVNDRKQNVAVKIFMENIDQLLETKSIRDIMKMSREPEHLLYAYHQIRQEVSFLSNLNHPNLTELCGVKTQPMCLLLELAPKKSLRAILKEYKDTGQALEPLSLKMTAKQIAGALEYLHDRQIVHLDVKSPNVLVWSFPLATFSQRDRIDQAGNILLKLADYGISQVSTRMTIRVANNPVGTPGFIAPEMFGAVKEVSADKLDVFAFGMTIYELLSHKAPFENIEPVAKRNHLIKDGQRPSLKGKELRSPLLLQELMVQCWSQNPEDRPKMRDVGRWISTLEFERLRAQVYLKDVKTLSCACVCRITPEQEVRLMFPPASFGSRGISNDIINTRSVQDVCFCDIIDDRGFSSEFDDGHSYLPPLTESSSEQREEPKDAQGDVLQEEAEQLAEVPVEDMQNQLLDPYTQIWLCGRDKCKGLVQIFTYHDNHSGSYTFTGYLSTEEVLTLCPVRNTMWMGTASGKLKVYHVPTLKCEYVGQLTSDTGMSILDMVHIKEVSAVMVTTSKGDIWIFHDQLCPRGLLIEEQLCLGEELTVFHFAKVVVRGCLELWGTTGGSCLMVLEKTREGWCHLELACDPGNSKLKVMAFLVHCGFVDSTGRRQNHVWASYWSRAVMVCWDVQARKQRCVFDCAKMFKNVDQIKDTECSTNVLSLAAHGRHVFVGTSNGSIGMVDSETCTVLKVYGWHQGKVRTLLVMPREVEASLCAEVPVGDQSDHTSADPRTGRVGTGPILRDLHTVSGIGSVSASPASVEPDACMVASIGNGRRQFVFQKSSPANKGSSDQEAAYGAVEDVYLLMWKAHRPNN